MCKRRKTTVDVLTKVVVVVVLALADVFFRGKQVVRLAFSPCKQNKSTIMLSICGQ